MTSGPEEHGDKIYALVDYGDAYVQPLLVAALKKHFPSRLHLLTSWDELPSKSSRVLQWVQYESINFEHLLQHPATSCANSYIIRKALIRKHYLSTTVANWIAKRPDSVLKKHVKPSVEFEVDYAEFLDEALVEAWELHEAWRRGEEGGEREWWILKPGMSERGQGIRLFSSEEELTTIFEGWDPESDDEEEEDGDGDEEDARSDTASLPPSKPALKNEDADDDDDKGIITSQLRHFIAQPYIHPPLLLRPTSSALSDPLRKFHIRTYVLATGALKVYVYRPMLALFAAAPYAPPSASSFADEEGLKAHLTNTCLQSTGDREGSVSLFWDLPSTIPTQPPSSPSPSSTTTTNPETTTTDTTADWKSSIFTQILSITGSIFEAAARGMSVHFQALPNAFEIFGLDFMVGIESDGSLNTWLLEVNAFPDFRQTGEECKGVVEGLMEGVVEVGVGGFFGEEKGGGSNVDPAPAQAESKSADFGIISEPTPFTVSTRLAPSWPVKSIQLPIATRR